MLIEPKLKHDRLLISASDEDRDGRYFKKTLEELDHLSLIRDRIGQALEQAEDSDEEVVKAVDEEDEQIEDEQEYDGRQDEGEYPSRLRKQLKLEDEWGLHRSRPVLQTDSENGEKDSSVTDHELRSREGSHVGRVSLLTGRS